MELQRLDAGGGGDLGDPAAQQGAARVQGEHRQECLAAGAVAVRAPGHELVRACRGEVQRDRQQHTDRLPVLPWLDDDALAVGPVVGLVDAGQHVQGELLLGVEVETEQCHVLGDLRAEGTGARRVPAE